MCCLCSVSLISRNHRSIKRIDSSSSCQFNEIFRGWRQQLISAGERLERLHQNSATSTSVPSPVYSTLHPVHSRKVTKIIEAAEGCRRTNKRRSYRNKAIYIVRIDKHPSHSNSRDESAHAVTDESDPGRIYLLLFTVWISSESIVIKPRAELSCCFCKVLAPVISKFLIREELLN